MPETPARSALARSGTAHPLDDDEAAVLGHLNYQEFGRQLARISGETGEIVEVHGTLRFATGTTFPVLVNGCWRLDPDADADEVLARTDQWFTARGRGWTLTLREANAADEDLRRAADALGIDAVSGSPEMVCDAPIPERPLPAGITLGWVQDRHGMDAFVAAVDAAYGDQGFPSGTATDVVRDVRAFITPGCHSVVAYDDGRPVAAAQTLLSHGAAGVYWVGTIPEDRGRGLGEAVTRAVTNRAFDLGARCVTLQASGMGEPIYARMGYRVLYRYVTHVRFASETPV